MIRLKKNVLFIFVLTVLAIFFISCEGPAGPAGDDGADGTNGTNGTNGIDGNVTCLECHATEDFEMKVAQFARSSHSVGAVDRERESTWSSGCVQCHTSQGFIEYATDGATMGGIVSGDNQFECKTCHTLHTTFTAEDYNLRLTTAASVSGGSDFLLKGNNTLNIQGFSNLCANCHQSRRAEPSIDVPGSTFEITSTHYGPHHGAQANVVAGVGFAEVVGSTAYPAAGSSYHMAASCTGCHMSEGNHDFTPQLDACNACHTTTDFNYGGVQDDISDLLDELRDALVAAGVLEYVEADEAYEPIVGTYPMAHAQAFFNWIGLTEDRSLGVHNPKYVEALLQNSIDSL
jgi:hypothetical protein